MAAPDTAAAAETGGPCLVGPRSAAELEAFGREIDALAAATRASLGRRDARYIRGLLSLIRITESVGRALLVLGAAFVPTWVLGSALLGLSKVLENMEFGHNVMHGQFDWMNDPRFAGKHHDWDNTCTKEDWREFHNHIHHHYCNVVGVDRDFGYGFLRLSADTRWEPRYLIQPIYVFIVGLLFQWAIAIHNLEFERLRTDREGTQARIDRLWPRVRAKMWKQVRKDYLAWPAIGAGIAGLVAVWQAVPLLPAMLTAFGAVAAGNAVANVIRNLWSFVVIFCGHFHAQVYTFDPRSMENETRGGWYLRQVLGSANISGSRLFHVLSGNLSHQIEHHLFPDLPVNRYPELAPQVRAICARYGVPYNTGRLSVQFFSMLTRVWRYSLPGGRSEAVLLSCGSPR